MSESIMKIRAATEFDPEPETIRREPDLREWAKAILFMAREGQPYDEKLLDAVQRELSVIATRYKEIGDREGWWQAIEEDTNDL